MEDVYLQSYFLLLDCYQQDGATKFYELILRKIDQAGTDLLKIESCLFMLKSLEVALKDDGLQSSILFTQKCFEKVLSGQIA